MLLNSFNIAVKQNRTDVEGNNEAIFARALRRGCHITILSKMK